MTGEIKSAIASLNTKMTESSPLDSISFEDYLHIVKEKPEICLRNIFQVFHDMIKRYLGEGLDEYSSDPESIHYLKYDCHELFVAGSENPFFADRLFANRLVNVVDSFRRSAQQNKIYVFKGPPGSGKSTFLNNLLRKVQQYVKTEEGACYEVMWRIDRHLLGDAGAAETSTLLEKLYQMASEHSGGPEPNGKDKALWLPRSQQTYLEIPCPSHDHPLVILPKRYRVDFLKTVLEGTDFQNQLFREKQYDWVFKTKPCTICSSLYNALHGKTRDPKKVHGMLHVRRFIFNRRLGEGVSVFNPGDVPMREPVQTNPILQRHINNLLNSSNAVKYLYSQYARTNNGIHALMDVKSHNKTRFNELHNIISEGIHKVEDVEENVNSILFAVMNPEDQKEIKEVQSFSDRIEYINIPYVMDINTEVEIYRNVFGKHIDERFLPGVLYNFARAIISTRLNDRSQAMLAWIDKPDKYSSYCDKNLLLLKMEIYTGYIPEWLSEEDRRQLTAHLRRKIIGESEIEGDHGISGRDSISIFNDFYSTYAKENKFITMSTVYYYFTKARKDLSKLVSKELLDSLIRMYDYTILQEVRESLYYYNKSRISKNIQNYLFSTSFEIGARQTCNYTGESIEVSEDFFKLIEDRLLGASTDMKTRSAFRVGIQKEYTSETLTQEILVEGKPIHKTRIFEKLHDRYVHNLKEKALDPFLENENFRRAIKDYNEKDFTTYDKRIRKDVQYLIKNLKRKFGYTELGAKEMCTYVIDKDLARQFGQS